MLKQTEQVVNKIKFFLERTTPLGALAQQRREKRGKIRPAKVRVEEKGSPPLPRPKFESPAAEEFFSRKFALETSRLDYIIIWGHGLKYQDQIIAMIQAHKDFRIIKTLYHYPRTIRSLVRAVYSYDYAPLSHLKSKTKYLMKTPKEVLFIFFENMNPNEDYFGKGIFRHFESSTLKQFKEEIRNKFNSRIDGKRTEHHVIHASDNELQTHKILQYLGFDGVGSLRKKHTVLEVPFYIRKCDKFTIKNVSSDSLVCNIAAGDAVNPHKIKNIPVKQSPHYLGLAENPEIYRQYVEKYFRREFTNYYTLDRFKALADKFEYLDKPYSTHYIAVRRLNCETFRITDGLHRAAILCHKGLKEVKVAILEQD